MALLVADHRQRGERKPAAAFYDFGGPVQLNQFFGVSVLDTGIVFSCPFHNRPLELYTGFSDAVGDRLYDAVVFIAVSVEHYLGNAFFQEPFPKFLADRATSLNGGFKVPELLFHSRNTRERVSSRIIDHLRVEVLVGSKYGHARFIGRARDGLPNMGPALFTLADFI